MTPNGTPQIKPSTPEKSGFSRTETIVLLIVLLALVCWGISVFIWGVPGLYIPALAMVPVIYVALILISRG